MKIKENFKDPLHPIYEDKCVRAVFKPRTEPKEPALQAMSGHEFVWAYVGENYKKHMWTPANPKDLEDYFELVGQSLPELTTLIVAESELDIFRVEILDG